MTRKAPDLIHGVEDRPPWAVTLLLAVQHLAMLSSGFIYPVVLADALGLSLDQAVSLLCLSMLAGGLSTMLQTLKARGMGSGWLVAMNPSSTYMPGALAAAPLGGLELIQTMTLAAGLAEALLARVIPKLRAYFPPEISGLVLVMIAVSLAQISFEYLFGQRQPGAGVQAASLAVGGASLAIMVALAVWGGRTLRLFCLILGMAAGWVLAFALGLVDVRPLHDLGRLPLAALPDLALPRPRFDLAVLAAFLAGALASAFKTSGNVIACQKMEDPDWKRADMRSIGGGLMAEAAGTVLAGLFGGMGQTSSSGNIGLNIATGATSRVIGLATGGLLVLLAFFPAFPSLLVLMPRPVMGAALIFSCCYTFIAGVQIMATRLLDARRTFVIGLSFMAGVAQAVDPDLFAGVPAVLRPIVDSSLALSVFLALGLNLVFRLGSRNSASLSLAPGQPWIPSAHDFLHQACAGFGARRDVAARADLGLEEALQLVEGLQLMEGTDPGTGVRVEVFFDEFNLDVNMAYQGPPLDLARTRPALDDLDLKPEDLARLSGYLLRTMADRVQVRGEKGRSVVRLHFEH